MTGGLSWKESAQLATQLEGAGFSGMLFTEAGSVPWMMIQAAATAAPSLHFTTGIAVAFPRSPMISAQVAWEMAQNTEGRFRLGLGSQIKPHVERRYGAVFDKPAPHMRDYVGAVKACIRAFRGEEKLFHEGPYYSLSLLPGAWAPTRHDFEDVKIDISAVGPLMCRVAGELCDGIHVHPLHSLPYLEKRLLPAVAAGAAKASRKAEDIDLIIPVFAIPGDSPEERARATQVARTQVAFYGSTRNYAFQFDDLGFEGTGERLDRLMKAGDIGGMASTISDEILSHFTLAARWDDMADALRDRYQGMATRIVSYLSMDDLRNNPGNLPRWGEIAKALRAG
jgi:probable F420-dependent oxidoreductase